MEQTILIAFFNNAVLLLVLSVVYEISYYVPTRWQRIQSILKGILIALICAAIMNMPFILKPGIIFDTRSILISVTALIFGTIPTLITVAVAALIRLSIGGSGTLVGIEVIVTSAVIGLAWRHWIYPKSSKYRWLSIYAMSVIVHLGMLLSMLLLPSPDDINVIREIAVPVLAIYPIASVLLSLLLIRQQDLKRFQDHLKLSEEKYRRIIDQISDVVWTTDMSYKLTYISPSFELLIGGNAERYLKRTLDEMFPPDSILKLKTLFADAMEIKKDSESSKEKFRVVELEQYHADGRKLWVNLSISIFHNDNGSPLGFHGVSRDITQLKKAEEKLRVSEERHRRLFETMAQGVVYQNADGTIISANPAAERILGITLDQMQGKTSMDPNWKAIREDGSEVNGLEHPAMVAIRTGKPNGPFIMGVFQPQINDHVWLSINAIPLFQPGDIIPFQVYATFQDITAERKANRNYQLLFQEMVNAFALHEIICDDEGKPADYKFLAINPAFEQMTGLNSMDILNKTVMEVMPDTESRWIETYGRVALTGEPIMFNNFSKILNKHFEVSAYQPSPNQFAVTFSDITEQIQAKEKASENLARLKGLLDNSPSPIVIIDDHGRFVEVSAVAEKIMGLPKEEILMKEITKIAPPDMVKKALYVLSQSPDDGEFLENIDVFEFEGNKRYFESRVFPIHDPNLSTELFGYLGIDVTDRITAEFALKENEEKYSSYIENAPFGVFVVDNDGQYIEVNTSASTITGYSKEQLVKMSINDITAEESLEAALTYFEMLKTSGYLNTELKYIHKNGSKRWWSLDAVKLSENRYLGFSSDITEKKDAESNYIHLINHDLLTGLYNRRFYEAELKRIDVPSRLPLSIIVGDINGLKLINDSFGNPEGDKIIVESAKLLSGCCREGDILARTGGDEFSILLPNTNTQTAKEQIKIIQDACREFNLKADNDIYHVNLSLGTDTKESVEVEFAMISNRAENNMNQRKLLEKNSLYNAIISSIKATMLEKSHETEEHAERITQLSRKVGIQLNLSQTELDQIELLATLHDIGKVGVAERILKKPGKLDHDEWVEMKKHPEIGYRIAMSTPNLAPIANYILCHHERWDGNGYPRNLKGTEIPLISRIIAVVDAYDAMTEDRVYRKAMTHDAAVEEIKKCTGTQFDPEIAQIFIAVIQTKGVLQEMAL